MYSSILTTLHSLDIPYKKIEHSPLHVVNDMIEQIKCDEPICHIKNLFLMSKKKNYYVFTIRPDTKIDLKHVSQLINDPGLRFGSVEALKDVLQLKPGIISPLASILDKELKVKFVFEESLKQETSKLVVQACIDTVSLLMNISDLSRYLSHSNHQIVWLDFFKKIESPIGEAIYHLKNLDSPKTMTSKKNEVGEMGITASKSDQFSEWYTQVIVKGELIDYYDISGCYVLRPAAYFMWEQIQNYLNQKFQALHVKNCYFPLFVSKSRLEAEKSHIEGFSPEVAWITKCGQNDLAEPIAIRPTSEAVMYPSYSKWIRSHRDLPLLLNQWNQVVRWEFKQPTPFIRTREFLWQEGHTAHATEKEAIDFAFKIIDIYQLIYEEVLAVPVIKGVKSENEKFAGGVMTITVETLIPSNGRAIQAATSHFLGQNFSKMFEIEYENESKKRQHVFQTSWGLTTRSIGVAIMLHGDDKGLVLPPRLANIQVVIIPIIFKNECIAEIKQQCQKIYQQLTQANIRTYLDDRDNYTPGWKYNEWDQKGVPLRIELGPKDLTQKSVRIVQRHNSEKIDHSWEGLVDHTKQLLQSMQTSLYNKALKSLTESIIQTTEWDTVLSSLAKKKLVLVPWSEDSDSEEAIKKATTRNVSDDQEQSENAATSLTAGMKALCRPFEQPPLPEGTKCFFTQKPAKAWWLFGRSY